MENPIDLAGIIWSALLGLPAQFAEAYQQNPGTWNLIGLALLGMLALGLLERRMSRRRRRTR